MRTCAACGRQLAPGQGLKVYFLNRYPDADRVVCRPRGGPCYRAIVGDAAEVKGRVSWRVV